jgi:hypothetical protein
MLVLCLTACVYSRVPDSMKGLAWMDGSQSYV